MKHHESIKLVYIACRAFEHPCESAISIYNYMQFCNMQEFEILYKAISSEELSWNADKIHHHEEVSTYL